MDPGHVVARDHSDPSVARGTARPWPRRICWGFFLPKPFLVGGWFTNPFEKYARQSNWIMKPQVGRGEEKKYI